MSLTFASERTLLAAVALGLFALAAAQQPSTEALTAKDDGALELRYLANEGFLIAQGDRRVLIDAFVAEPYYEYAALTPELLRDLETAKGAFADIDLALTSHIHRDHFQADVAVKFLTADARAPMWSSSQVVDAIRTKAPQLPGEAARLRAFAFEVGKSDSAKLETGEKLEVETFPLFHVEGIQNLAHLIRFEGHSVLHVGDAGLIEKEFAPFELARRGIDVALVPYWFLTNAEDCAKVREWIGARHYVAMHVPPKEFKELRASVAAHMPEAVWLETGGEAKRFPRRGTADAADGKTREG